MRCSTGRTGTYHFKRLSLERGYGVGSYGRQSMTFTYGLTIAESEPYLKLPAGKKLEHNGKMLALVDISPVAPRRPISAGSRKTQSSY
jgi:hypothetical protein